MTLSVRVIPKASRNAVEQLGPHNYKVWVTVVPENGRANKKVIELLAAYLDTPKSSIAITRGETSNNKTIEIADR